MSWHGWRRRRLRFQAGDAAAAPHHCTETTVVGRSEPIRA
jgi:hypothetical protein